MIGAYLGERPGDVSPSDTSRRYLGDISAISRQVGFIVSFIGATLGSCLVYIFPALLYLAVTNPARNSPKNAPSAPSGDDTGGAGAGTVHVSLSRRVERATCRALVGLGSALGVVGGAVTVISGLRG